MNRRTIALATAAAATAAVLVLSGCSSTSSSGGGGSSGNTVFTVSGLPTGFDPVSGSTGIGSLYVVRSAYEGLVNQKPGTYDVEPGLATSWTESADKLTYTFALRSGVKFTDGTDFNADAFTANYDRIKALGGQVAGILSNISSVTAPDEKTVVITLAKPEINFLSALTFAVVASPEAIKEHAKGTDQASAWFAQNTDGTGPYKLGTSVEGQSLTLVRNKEYWGGWKSGQIDTVRFVEAADTATSIQQLKKGEIDTLSGITNTLASYLDQLKATSGLTVYTTSGTQVDEIQMNTQKAPLNNVKVRQAVSLAYDYEAAAKSAYQGQAEVPSGGLPPSYPGFDKSLQPLSQNLDKAKQLLADSGATIDKPLTIYYYQPLAFEKAEATVLQDSLGKIGIKSSLVATTWDQMVAAQKSPSSAPDFDSLWHGPITADPAEYLGSYFEAKYIGGYNWSFFSNSQFDSLIDSAQFTSDTTTRDNDLSQAQQILIDQAPALFTAVPKRVEVVSSKFTGYKIHPVDYGGDVFFYDLRVKK